jgi:hypothetical protein
MTTQEFITKWQGVSLTEREAAQQHFLDLCEVFHHPKPAAEAIPTGPVSFWLFYSPPVEPYTRASVAAEQIAARCMTKGAQALREAEEGQDLSS